jgi:hypothetical protein
MKPINRLFFAVLIFITVLPLNAQNKKYTENPEVMKIFDQLKTGFLSGFGTISNNLLCREVFENDTEQIKKISIDKIKNITSQLDKLDAEHKFTEVLDSTGSYRVKYTINLRQHKTGQAEYLTFTFNKSFMDLKYVVKDDKVNLDNDINIMTPQSTIDKIDLRLKSYLEKKNTMMKEVVFDKDYHINIYYSGTNSPTDKKTVGKRFIIHNCTEDDYIALKDFLKANATDDGIYYGEFYDKTKMTTMRLIGSDMHPIIIGVTMKGSDLHIVRAVGTKPWACVLPLNWAEGVGDIDNDDNSNSSDVITDRVYEIENVDELPSFPGGQAELNKFLKKNMIYPPEDAKNGVMGRVLIEGVVQKTGKLIDIHVINGIDHDIDAEAERLVRLMPRWVCATKNGLPVNCKFVIPIDFIQ